MLYWLFESATLPDEVSVWQAVTVGDLHKGAAILHHSCGSRVLVSALARHTSCGLKLSKVKHHQSKPCLLPPLCRSARVHWCFGLWPHNLLPSLHFLAAGEEAFSDQLAFLGFLGLHHRWGHHHNLGRNRRHAWHHCRR